jgi:hypothetical protein
VPTVSRRLAVAVLAVLSLQFGALAAYEAWHDAPTVDEATYLASGVTALTRHDLRINTEHPPLGKVLAAAPVLLGRPVVPRGPAWDEARQFEYGAEFLRAQRSAGRLQRVVFLGRLVPIAEALLAGVLLYALGGRLFGRAAGLLAASLWLTSPWAVGLGHLNGIDLPFALAVLGCCVVLARHVDRPSPRTVIAAGASGVSACSRASGDWCWCRSSPGRSRSCSSRGGGVWPPPLWCWSARG